MQTVSWAGSTYNIPNQRGDTPWSGLSDFAIAVAAKGINTGGGNFTLLADLNLGASFGLVSAYFKSRTANIATAGVVRLASADTIQWRNNANGGNVSLSKNTSDELLWNGSRLLLAGGGLIVNADISASAAVAYSKLNLSASIVNADIATAAAIAFSKLAALTASHILVGSAGNVATDVALSGDATLAATGALTLATINGNVGSFTNTSITVNAKGLVTAAASGTAPVTSVSGTANQITSTGGTTPVLALASPLTTPGSVTIAGSLTFSPTTAGIVGTPTNDDAAAGRVGEYISASAAAVTVTTSITNVTSIALTAGDWDISMFITQGGAGTTNVFGTFYIATASGASTGTTFGISAGYFSTNLSSAASGSIGRYRVKLTGNQTYYLNASFSTNTSSVDATLSARRMR